MMQALANAIMAKVMSIQTVQDIPDLIPQFEAWLDRETTFWLPVVEPILADLGVDQGKAGLVETLAAWFILNFTAGPLDNLFDNDKDLGYWSEVSRGESMLVATALIGEALSLPPVEANPETAKATRVLAVAMRNASLGQLQDVRGVDNLDDYEAMISLKSGAIFRALFEAIGALGGVPEERQHSLAEFGRVIGILTQIQNDIQGVWNIGATNEVSDLQKAQLTLPSLLALKALEHQPERREELQILLSVSPGSRNEEQILTMILDTPAKGVLVKMLRLWIRNVRNSIAQAELSSEEEILKWLAITYPLEMGH